MTFQERFQAARDKHGHTQEQAARIMGISTNTVCSWERQASPAEPNRPGLYADQAERYIAGELN